MLYGKYPDVVWKISRCYMGNTPMWYGKYPDMVWKISRCCMETIPVWYGKKSINSINNQTGQHEPLFLQGFLAYVNDAPKEREAKGCSLWRNVFYTYLGWAYGLYSTQ